MATTIKPSPTCFICSAAQEITFQGVQDLEYQTYRPVDFAVCPKCRLVSQHPLPPAELLPIFYPGEYRNYQPLEETFFSALKKFQFQGLVQKITRHFGQGKQLKILEIGFGNGQLLLALKANGYSNLYGIDFSDRYFSSLKSAGIRVQTQNLEKDFPFSEHFDVIFMVNVVEHFLDPEGVLKNCRDHLTQTGKVILITPNTNALEFSWFKKYWAGFHAPRHIHLFTAENMAQLGQKLGFSKAAAEPMADPGQFSISIQNFFQDRPGTKVKLKHGMAWYLLPLTLLVCPWVFFQNFIGRGTSMLCVLEGVAQPS